MRNLHKYQKEDSVYQASKIYKRLTQFEPRIRSQNRLDLIGQELIECFKPWGVRVEILDDESIIADEIIISGEFDVERKRQNILLRLYFKVGKNKYRWNDENWKSFRFLTSQVLQHELIHRHQHLSRPEEAHRFVEYYPVAASNPMHQKEMDYLSELDEIEAYAHDLALEILYYYPKQDPYAVLKTINKRRYAVSYKIYKKAFRTAEDWKQVHDKLLKKTYQWLAHVSI